MLCSQSWRRHGTWPQKSVMLWQLKDNNISWGVSHTWWDNWLQQIIWWCYSVPLPLLTFMSILWDTQERYYSLFILGGLRLRQLSECLRSYWYWVAELEIKPRALDLFHWNVPFLGVCGLWGIGRRSLTQLTWGPLSTPSSWIKPFCSSAPSEKVALWQSHSSWTTQCPCSTLRFLSPVSLSCSSLWPGKPNSSPHAESSLSSKPPVRKLLWCDTSFMQPLLTHWMPVPLQLFSWMRVLGMGQTSTHRDKFLERPVFPSPPSSFAGPWQMPHGDQSFESHIYPELTPL